MIILSGPIPTGIIVANDHGLVDPASLPRILDAAIARRYNLGEGWWLGLDIATGPEVL